MLESASEIESVVEDAEPSTEPAPSLAKSWDESFDLAVRCFAACSAIALVGWLDARRITGVGPLFLVASLGASAVLVFGVPDSPMATLRSVLGGHVVSAIVGVTCFRFFGAEPWLSGALAVAIAIFLMHRTGTTHPPGGATALIANVGPDEVTRLGYTYVATPVLAGAAVLVIVGITLRHLRKRLVAEARD